MTQKRLKIDRKFFFLLISLMLVEYVRAAFIISYLPVQAAVGTQFNLALVGLAISLHYISDAFSNFQAGFLMNRFGIKKIISVSFILIFLSLIVVPLFQFNGFVIILASILLGFGACPIWIVLLAKASSGSRGTNMGLIYFYWLLGMASGVIVMNYLMNINLSVSYWILPVFVVLAFFSFRLSGDHQALENTKQPFKEMFKKTLSILKKSRIILPGTLMQSISLGMLIPILPTFVLQHLKLTYNQYTLLLIIAGLTAGLLMMPIGRLIDYFSPRLLFIAGFMWFGFTLISTAFNTSIVVIYILVVSMAIAYTFFLPAWNSFVATKITKEDQNVSWGIISSFQGVGTMLGPIIGSLLASFNSSVTVIFSASLFILMGILYLIVK